MPRLGYSPFLLMAGLGLAGCAGGAGAPRDIARVSAEPAPEYVLGPGDTLSIFVYRAPAPSCSAPAWWGRRCTGLAAPGHGRRRWGCSRAR